MDIRRIDDNLSVSPQIDLADLPAIRAAGFRSLIGNRPDGESADQPPWSRVQAAAAEAGLQTRHLPVVTGAITSEQVDAFGRLLNELPGPVLAFCRSGTRSTMLWGLSQQGRRSHDELIAAAAAAGYDLSTVLTATNR